MCIYKYVAITTKKICIENCLKQIIHFRYIMKCVIFKIVLKYVDNYPEYNLFKIDFQNYNILIVFSILYI